MLGMVSNYNRNEHTIIGGELGPYISCLGKQAKRDLTVIRYEKLGVFCIIEFLSPRRDVFIDIMNLGKSLANFGRLGAAELRRRLFGQMTCEEESRALFEADSDFHHKMDDDNKEESERLEKMSRGE